ncbi:MAG: lysophospholipid acyltransferase family protein [Ktedonobacterales bacterium]
MADPRQREGRASGVTYGATKVFARLIVPLVAKLRTVGLEHVPPTGPVLLAMNHIHWMDIPLASLRVPRRTHYMAKIELFGKPVLGGFIRELGAFPVRRGEGDREAIRTAERLLARNGVVVIFPEGHRSDNGALIQAHPGAAYLALRTGVPVVPVAISGTRQVFKGLHYGPWRPEVIIRYGHPVTFGSGGRVAKENVARATDDIMYRIAALLPPAQRGPYGSAPQIIAESAEAKPHAEVEPVDARADVPGTPEATPSAQRD